MKMQEDFQDPHENTKEIPMRYFDLINKVGSDGLYQKHLFYVFFLSWLVTGLLLMGTSFLFLLPTTNCNQLALTEAECDNYICSLPPQQRPPFYFQQKVNSLSTQFGPFQCDQIYLVNALKMTLYAGTFFGYLLMPLITDNLGRRYSILVSSALTSLGILVLSLSSNIWVACGGLFLAGFGGESSIRTSTVILAEVAQSTLRQKYTTLLMASFGVGSILVSIIYYLLQDWRMITIIFCLIPSLISLLSVVYFVKETPKFLIDKNPADAVKVLNEIGEMNHKKSGIISISDLQKILQNQSQPHLITPLSLCTYKSQLKNYIPLSLTFFCIFELYFGPFIIITKLKMDIFVSQAILGLSQLVAYPISYFFIENIPRKASGMILFALSALAYLGLSGLPMPEDCNWCLMGKIQLVMVFVARFSLCLYTGIFYLFIGQLFPLPLRGTGYGMVSLWGAVASTSSQYMLPYLSSKQMYPMVLFMSFSLIGMVCLCFLPETLGKQLKEKIPQDQAFNEETGLT